MRIFVSHCAKHDARSAVVVQRLVDDLSDGEVQLVWDRDLLGVGDDWNDKLLTEMESCDGAILLLSAAALKRPYVVMECTILAQRKRHSEKWGGNTFELLSVLVGGLTPEDLVDQTKSHMKDLGLGRYQAGDDQSLDALVASLKAPLERLKLVYRRNAPRDLLLSDIARQLTSSKPGSDAKLASLLRIDLPAWVQAASAEVRALAVAAAMPEKKLRAVGRALAEARDDIKQRDAVVIVERLAPFALPGDAAARIPCVAHDLTRPKAFEINAEHLDIGRWYARLAYGSMLVTTMTEVTNADSGLGFTRLVEEIVESVMEKVDAETPEEALEELKDIGTPFFVVIPCTRPLSDVVFKVHERFPTITLLFLSGSRPSRAHPVANVSLLEPLLEIGHEQTVRSNYEKTIEAVREAHEARSRR